jgi:hypothetical protein
LGLPRRGSSCCSCGAAQVDVSYRLLHLHLVLLLLLDLLVVLVWRFDGRLLIRNSVWLAAG